MNGDGRRKVAQEQQTPNTETTTQRAHTITNDSRKKCEKCEEGDGDEGKGERPFVISHRSKRTFWEILPSSLFVCVSILFTFGNSSEMPRRRKKITKHNIMIMIKDRSSLLSALPHGIDSKNADYKRHANTKQSNVASEQGTCSTLNGSTRLKYIPIEFRKKTLVCII